MSVERAIFSLKKVESIRARSDDPEVIMLCDVLIDKLNRISQLEQLLTASKVQQATLAERMKMINQHAANQLKANPHDSTAKKVKTLTSI